MGPQVRRLRVEQHLTQEQLTAQCQVQGTALSRGTLAKIEAGIRGVCGFEAYVLAKALGVPLDALFPKDMARQLKDAFQKGTLRNPRKER